MWKLPPLPVATADRKLSHGAYASYSSPDSTVNDTRQGRRGQGSISIKRVHKNVLHSFTAHQQVQGSDRLNKEREGGGAEHPCKDQVVLTNSRTVSHKAKLLHK